MCGIVGIFGKKVSSQNLKEQIIKMSSHVAHRGPDGNGNFVDNGIALGHRRLSIIDLSDNGKQPLWNEDQSIHMVFNGEIYNYKELRQGLIERGHKFTSESDGEVIIHLYEEHSYDCLLYLEGMFSFAIYDKKENKLFLARDRIGEKPLYYLWHDNTFYFASEIKSFVDLPNFNFEISEEGLTYYFANTQVPAPFTIYKHIYKIIPSHYYVVHENNDIETKQYWHIDYTDKFIGNTNTLVVELENLFINIIDKTLASDVPIGVTLSGGIDSSLVLSLMKKVSNLPFKTFSLGKNSNGVNDLEIERANIVSKRYDTAHHILKFDEMLFSDCELVMSRFCEPIGIFDNFHMFYLNKYIKDYLKVVLTGNGADEIFGGYASYCSILTQSETMNFRDTSVQNKQLEINQMIYENYYNDIKTNSFMLFSKDMEHSSVRFNLSLLLEPYFKLATYDNFLDARLFIDLLIAVNHSATLMDIIGMAHSLEVRSPFLNPLLIKFAASLPLHLKVRNKNDENTNKYILKILAQRYLPDDLIFISKLRCGQFIDYHQMMKSSWKVEMENLLFDYGKRLSAYFCQNKIKSLWSKFISNSTSELEDQNLRKLFIFILWHKNGCLVGK
jgi:asparagine synthase (glutamine-hydrolysing)